MAEFSVVKSLTHRNAPVNVGERRTRSWGDPGAKTFDPAPALAFGAAGRSKRLELLGLSQEELAGMWRAMSSRRASSVRASPANRVGDSHAVRRSVATSALASGSINRFMDTPFQREMRNVADWKVDSPTTCCRRMNVCGGRKIKT